MRSFSFLVSISHAFFNHTKSQRIRSCVHADRRTDLILLQLGIGNGIALSIEVADCPLAELLRLLEIIAIAHTDMIFS